MPCMTSTLCCDFRTALAAGAIVAHGADALIAIGSLKEAKAITKDLGRDVFQDLRQAGEATRAEVTEGPDRLTARRFGGRSLLIDFVSGCGLPFLITLPRNRTGLRRRPHKLKTASVLSARVARPFTGEENRQIPRGG